MNADHFMRAARVPDALTDRDARGRSRRCGAPRLPRRRPTSAARRPRTRSGTDLHECCNRGAVQAMHDQCSRFSFFIQCPDICIGQQAERCLMQALGSLVAARTCTRSACVWGTACLSWAHQLTACLTVEVSRPGGWVLAKDPAVHIGRTASARATRRAPSRRRHTRS